MKSQTQSLRKLVCSAMGIRAKLNVLRRQYAGETAYIVSCGPSLSDYPDEVLFPRLKNELVLCVKQAYHRLAGITDFHLLNPVHLETYQYHEPRPISLFMGSGKSWDLVLPRVEGPWPFFEKNLAITHDFEPWTLEKSVARMPACGIVPTVGFYLALYLGASRIVTVGYDLTDGGANHYYSSDKRPWDNRAMLDQMAGESEPAAAAAEHWRAWLKSKGVEWVRAEASSPINLPTIPTVEL